MSLKRSFMPDFYKQQKKICLPKSVRKEPTIDVKSSLLHLHSLFPVNKFEGRLPVIIMKHQLYSFHENKTEVDRQLNDLRNSGEIRFFHLGEEVDDLSMVFSEEYHKHVRKLNQDNPLIEKFLTRVLTSSTDIILTKEISEKFKIKENDITELIRAGVLTVREVGSWWVSIPGAGEFMKCYIKGRKSILQSIRRTKYGEMLQMELEKRQLPRTAKLGITYHIHDIIGAELVDCINTTSGPLLRAKEL